MIAQTATRKLAAIQKTSLDTTLKLSGITESDKTSNNPAFYFKELFETDALAINANSGPRLNPLECLKRGMEIPGMPVRFPKTV